MGEENSICCKRASSAPRDPIVIKSASDPIFHAETHLRRSDLGIRQYAPWCRSQVARGARVLALSGRKPLYESADDGSCKAPAAAADPTHAPGMFAFADHDHVTEVLAAAD